MSKSIRVTMTRPSTLTIWPFDLFPWINTLDENYFTFEDLSVESWIIGNEDADLTLVVDHVFASEESFNTNKDTVYTMIPLWCNSQVRADSESYCTDNGINIIVEEIDNPDLSNSIKILVTHKNIRTYEALRTAL